MDVQIFNTLPLLTQIINWIGTRRLLIVFDNFEHLLNLKNVILRLSLETKHAKFLITSRQALNLQLEYLHHLTRLDNQSGLDASAVKMVDFYASRANSTFSLKKELSQVIRVCRTVEGMPLAIQLASAWIKSISCQSIAEAITENCQNLKLERDLNEQHRLGQRYWR